jgi:hypothetical protein
LTVGSSLRLQLLHAGRRRQHVPAQTAQIALKSAHRPTRHGRVWTDP